LYFREECAIMKKRKILSDPAGKKREGQQEKIDRTKERECSMKIFISACLLGCPCRYDGNSKPHPDALALAGKHTLIPFCPECYGGLPTPRPPAEITGNAVRTEDGTDVTVQYRRGAELALEMYRLTGCERAVLKEKSPSCGCGKVYDGTHTGTLTDGNGITAALFLENGISVTGESGIRKEFDI